MPIRSNKNKETLAEKTYEEIKDLIVTGKLTQRERVSESQLAESLRISRTPIREAIRMLEQDGLVSRDSMGAYVTALTKQEAIDLYTVRIELEVLSVRLAVENASLDDLQILSQIVEQIKYARKHHHDGMEVTKILETNTEFHSHLAKMSNNFYLQHTLKDIRTRLSLLRASSLLRTKRGSISHEEHLEIAEAILNKDVKGAVKLVEAHSKNAADFALSHTFE